MNKILLTICLIIIFLTSARTADAAVTQSTLITNSDINDLATYTTASMTPTANRLIIVTVASRVGTGTANQPTLTGNGLTWVVVNSVALSNRRVTVFRSMGSSPSAGALQFSFGGQTQTWASWTVSQFDGIDTTGTHGSGAVVQSAVNSSTSSITTISSTLASFGSAANATFGVFHINNQQTMTVGSGFTKIHEAMNNGEGAGGTLTTEWKDTNDTSVDISWPAASQNTMVIALEIKASTGPVTIASNTGNNTYNSIDLGVTANLVNPSYFGARFGTSYNADCSALPYSNSTAVSAGAGQYTNQRFNATAGLSPSTAYYYCATVWDYVAGQTYYGNVLGPVSTTAVPAPIVQNYGASLIDDTSAVLNAGVHGYGVATTGFFRWGQSPTYTTGSACSSLPNTTTNLSSGSTNGIYYPRTHQLTGLSPSTTYVYCFHSTNGSLPGYSGVTSVPTLGSLGSSCELFPGSSLANSANSTTVKGYLGTSKMKGTLLYKGTVNGWTLANFHTAVDNQGANIVLMNNNSNGKIFGAFTPNSWNSAGNWISGAGAFLFSLSDGYKLNQNGYASYQMLGQSTRAPYYGGGGEIAGPSSANLNTSWTNSNGAHTYQAPSSQGAFTYISGAASFTPSEVEIYKIEPCTTSVPALSLPTNTSPTFTAVTLGATVDSDGGAAISERGVCYAFTSTDSSPGFTTPTGSTPESGVTCVSASATSPYTVAVTVEPNKAYTYRGYARNTIGNGYSTTGTFNTPNNAPTGVTTNAESNLASYKVTFNGTANPNGSQGYGYFKYFTSVPDCSVDAGGARMPISSTADYNIGSGSATQDFNYTTPTSVQLIPDTDYWYCAYSRNTAAPGSPGTAASNDYEFFHTPDGPASGCDAPTSGNMTISEACAFPQSDFDGVDNGGNGTCNTAVLSLNSGGNIAVLPGQVIGRGGGAGCGGGGIVMNGGSISVVNGSGGTVRGGVWIKDSDGDGVIDQPIVKTVSSNQPAGYIRRNHVYTLPTYSNSSFNYASKIYNAVTNAPTFLDCDQESANAWRFVTGLVTDADNDGYKTATASMQQCVGANHANYNGTGRTYYSATSSAVMWLPVGSIIGGSGTDCNDSAAVPCPPTPGAFTSVGTTAQTLNWTANTTNGPSATSYDVLKCGTDSDCDTPSTSNTGSISFVDNSPALSCGNLYYYRLLAKNGVGSGALTSPFSNSTSVCASGATVTTSAATAQTTTTAILNSTVNPNNSPTNITYRWQTGATGTCNSGTPTNPLAGPTNLTGTNPLSGGSTQQGLTGLSAATRYYFCATAVNVFPANYGSVLNFTTAPNAPTSPAANNVGNQRAITVTWTASSGGSETKRYNVYWCNRTAVPGCVPLTQGTKVDTGSSSTSYTLSGLTCGSQYAFSVSAYTMNNGGESAQSSVVTDSATAGSSITCYLSADDDEFAAAGASAIPSCNSCATNLTATQPTTTGGAGNTDCHDGDNRARPGQTNYYGTPARPDGSFDFNCDGSQTYAAPGSSQTAIFCSYPQFPACSGTTSITTCGLGTSLCSLEPQGAGVNCAGQFVPETYYPVMYDTGPLACR